MTCGAKSGELCSTIDAKGNTTSYGYDANGNVTSITPPSPLGATTIVPDSLSRVSSVTDGKGQTTRYSYDNLDRITQILYGGATSCTPGSATCTSFVYDEDGNLTSRTDNTGTTSFLYDTMNRVKTKSLPDTTVACSGSNPAGMTFSYDDADKLKTYCDAGGTIAYGYDAANRLTALAEPGGSVTIGGGCNAAPCSFSYDNDDRRTQARFPGGATLNLTYDNSGNQLTAIGKDSINNVLSSFTYTYNQGTSDRALTQTVTEADAVFRGTTTYGYDAFNRLTSATNTKVGNLSYGYDANGNRTSDNSGSYSYNAANQLTASPGVSSWSYDGNGNVSGNSAGASLSYNAKNQTTAMTYGGQTISSLSYADVDQTERTQAGALTFLSSPLGLQIQKSAGQATFYTRDNSGNIIGERLPSGARWYFLNDGLGSIVAVINDSGGTVGNRYGYDPYGKSTFSSGSVANPWGFAGGYLDPTGLVKFGTRYYDPGLGRWTQQDPIAGLIASPRTMDRYVYVGDDPINVVDLTGRFSWAFVDATVAWVGFFAAAGALVAIAILGAPVWVTALAIVGLAVATYSVYRTGCIYLGTC